MTSQYRSNRKISDNDLIKYNSLGLSLKTISRIFSCHPTTITQRLRDLGIPVADTRRSFMEDVYDSLTAPQQEFLADQLSATSNVKDYVRQLIINDYLKSI